VEEISKQRFEALAGYTRLPITAIFTRELAGFRSSNERVLGAVTLDLHDDDFGWVALGRDERARFRCIDVNTSLPSFDAARDELLASMARLAASPDGAFFQGDAAEPPVDFFAPAIPVERMHPSFRTLLESRGFSPAREIIQAMMRYHVDIDGHFIPEFQSVNFDARIWELYLFAAFTEQGFATSHDAPTPDFLWSGPKGSFAMEATTLNPPPRGARSLPDEIPELVRYFENFVPIKLARSLGRKLRHNPPYWSMDHTRGLPFVIAVQDFHAPNAMTQIAMVLRDYLYGLRYREVDGERTLAQIGDHRYGDLVEPSGFFFQNGAENVSAIIANPQGTLSKFNRIGYVADFGDRTVKMIKRGQRVPMPNEGTLHMAFEQRVDDPEFNESWTEGMVVFHNPRALYPLDRRLIPDAAHEFLVDGAFMTSHPEFHPTLSETLVVMSNAA
jgi:hypothetical protein